MNVDPALVFAARALIALLFLTAAAHKLRDFTAFTVVLAGYGVPGHLTLMASAVVVTAEICAGVGVALGVVVASVLAASLLIGYACGMAATLLGERRQADCGCSTRSQPVSWALVVRNLLIVPVALVGVLPFEARTFSLLDYACIGGGVLAAALLYGAANELIAARSRLEEWV